MRYRSLIFLVQLSDILNGGNDDDDDDDPSAFTNNKPKKNFMGGGESPIGYDHFNYRKWVFYTINIIGL